DAQRPQTAGSHMWQAGSGGGKHHLDLSTQEIVDRRAAALVRNAHEIDTGHGLEQLGREMVRSACTARSIVELSGPGSGPGRRALSRNLPLPTDARQGD